MSLRADKRVRWITFGIIATALLTDAARSGLSVSELDPRGQTHVPIGIANTLDSLKTFVEAEGIFSPGVGTYGIYYWVYSTERGRLFAPTMNGVTCVHGLTKEGYLIPWSQWRADDVEVRSEAAHALQESAAGSVHLVASRVTLTNTSGHDRTVLLYAALRGLGPAGYAVRALRVDHEGSALLVDGRAALVAKQHPERTGVVGTDTIGEFAMRGAIPPDNVTWSDSGDCSGAMRFDVELSAGQSKTLRFICPVLPGRRAVRHEWDGVSEWAQFDLAKPNPETGGVLQPDPGVAFYQQVSVDKVFADARSYWEQLVGRVTLRLPDQRWAEAFAAITGHAALAMNVAGTAPRLIWYAPQRSEGESGGSATIFDLIPDQVGWIFWQLCLAVGLLAVWRARRLGPLVAEDLPVVVRASETVEGRGRLYRSRRAADRAADALRTAALQRMLPRLGLAHNASPPAVVQTVAARCGLPPQAD